MPPGIAHIVANECAERFSFYGMKSILVVFMTHYMNAERRPSEAAAREYYHLFNSAVYATPLLGAIVAEGLLGKYRTIMGFSLVYCGGHLALALSETPNGLAIGLSLIALGSGGIKPCVSANVGDQFGRYNVDRLPTVYSYFYLAINLGSFTSTLATPALLASSGSHAAFGVPGLIMAVATLVFYAGRHHYTHVPPHGLRFVRECFSKEGVTALSRLIGLYLFVAVFWSLYDQTSSSWVLQAEHMNRRLGIEWLPSQVQAINPLLILILVPTFNGFRAEVPPCVADRCGALGRWLLRVRCDFPGLYALAARRVRVTPLRKIGLGFFLTAASFLLPLYVQSGIDAGRRPSIAWHLAAYVILTVAEVLVSVTGLEFSYTQAPPRMKSLVMAFWLLAVAVGNAFTSLVNACILDDDGSSRWSDGDYYAFFSAVMVLTACAFVPFACRYREVSYLHGERGVVPPESLRRGGTPAPAAAPSSREGSIV